MRKTFRDTRGSASPCMGRTLGCENETRCNVRTFEDLQAEPRFFC